MGRVVRDEDDSAVLRRILRCSSSAVNYVAPNSPNCTAVDPWQKTLGCLRPPDQNSNPAEAGDPHAERDNPQALSTQLRSSFASPLGVQGVPSILWSVFIFRTPDLPFTTPRRGARRPVIRKSSALTFVFSVPRADFVLVSSWRLRSLVPASDRNTDVKKSEPKSDRQERCNRRIRLEP